MRARGHRHKTPSMHMDHKGIWHGLFGREYGVKHPRKHGSLLLFVYKFLREPQFPRVEIEEEILTTKYSHLDMLATVKTYC